MSSPAAGRASRRDRLRLHGWRHPSVLVAALLSVFSGYGQFSATAALPDVAAAFGEQTTGASIAAQVGLSGTTLGIGLALIRLASLAALPLSQRADRHGRRVVLLVVTALGLTFTALSALSPSYWWFVALFALGRPLLSTTNAVAGVVAAEETRSSDRAKAVALITAGYGLGAGIPIVLRGIADAVGAELSFRVLFGLAGVLLLVVPLAARVLEEPDRRARLLLPAGVGPSPAVRLGHVPPALRPRMVVVAGTALTIALATGPFNTYLFVFAESVAGVPAGALTWVGPAAGVLGLAGLLIGRQLADRLGRRWTAVGTHALVGLCGLLTYSGPGWGAITGYLLTVLIAAAYAPAAVALGSEVFPTSMRATAAGWVTVAGTVGAVVGLLAFGWLADALGSFLAAAAVIATPVVLTAVAYRLLPETRGLELEESAPEPT